MIYYNEIKDIVAYYKLQGLTFSINSSSYKSFIDIYLKLFKKEITLNEAKIYITKIRDTGYTDFFEKTSSMANNIKEFINYSLNNKIIFSRGSIGYEEIQNLYLKLFDNDISLASASSYASAIRKKGHQDLFINKEDHIKKIELLVEYCQSNNVILSRGSAGYHEIKNLFFEILNTEITIGTARHYTKIIRKNTYLDLFKESLSYQENIKLLIENCRTNKVLFSAGSIGYIQIKALWLKLFNKNISLSTATTIAFDVRKAGHEWMFIKSQTTSDKSEELGNHFRINNIILPTGKNGYQEIKDLYKKLFNKDITLNRARTFASLMRKNNYLDIFELPSKNKSNIELLIEYCEKNNIIFSDGSDGHQAIKDLWLKLFDYNLTLASARGYATTIRKLGYVRLFKVSSRKIDNFIQFAHYCHKNNITFSNDSIGFKNIQKLYVQLFNKNINIEEIVVSLPLNHTSLNGIIHL